MIKAEIVVDFPKWKTKIKNSCANFPVNAKSIVIGNPSVIIFIYYMCMMYACSVFTLLNISAL